MAPPEDSVMSDDSEEEQPWRTAEGQVLPSFPECWIWRTRPTT